MFETEMPPEPESLAGAADETVVAAIEGWNRIEAAASARRLDAIAELTGRRCDQQGQRAHWACDGWDSAAGEVAAALGATPRKASNQMTLGLTLRHRLPKLAALYREGKVSHRVVSTIAWQTHLVDDEALHLIDTALAQRAAAWGELSDYKLTHAIDVWVHRHDPDALIRLRNQTHGRELSVGKKNDESDTTAVWGRLYGTDAALLDRRLMELAHSVCDDDPRSIAERRADALGVLAAGGDRLACTCQNPHCPATNSDARASNVVIHVVSEASALEATPELGQHGAKPAAGLLLRGKIVPTPLLAELIRSGATVSTVHTPADGPEPGYVPSGKLAEFVRCRDLTCRFPGCEEPAEFCDIDHTIPYPVGLTHPSNLKCLCRKHHLLKTFWTGIDGWADQQLADGTIVWTAPTGKTYKTFPGSQLFFPAWNTTTAQLPQRDTPVAGVNNRAVMMPKRRRTRAADRTHRIQEDRALNAASIAALTNHVDAHRNKPPPVDLPPSDDIWDIGARSTTCDDDPPPF